MNRISQDTKTAIIIFQVFAVLYVVIAILIDSGMVGPMVGWIALSLGLASTINLVIRFTVDIMRNRQKGDK